MISNNKHAIPSGFLAFHSNRSERLAEVVISWIKRHPLSPLEDEIILVQSNGMAESLGHEATNRPGNPDCRVISRGPIQQLFALYYPFKIPHLPGMKMTGQFY